MVIQDDTRATRNNVTCRCRNYNYPSLPPIRICSADLVEAKATIDNVFKSFWAITHRSFDKIRLQTEPFLERLKTRSVCRKCSNNLPVSTSKSTQIPETNLVTMRRFSDEYVGKVRRQEESNGFNQERRRYREEETAKGFRETPRFNECCDYDGRRYGGKSYQREEYNYRDSSRSRKERWREQDSPCPCSMQKKISRSCHCVICEECKRKKRRKFGYYLYCYVKKKLERRKRVCECPSFCECRKFDPYERKFDVGTNYSTGYLNLKSSGCADKYKICDPVRDSGSCENCCCCCCCCCCDGERNKLDCQCQCEQTAVQNLQTDYTQTDAFEGGKKKCCCRCCCKKKGTSSLQRQNSPSPPENQSLTVTGNIKQSYTGSLGKTRIYKSSSTQHQPTQSNDLVEVLLSQRHPSPIFFDNEFYSPLSGQKYNLAPKTINSEPINFASTLLSEEVFPSLDENKFDRLKGSLANRNILSAAYNSIVNNFSVHQFSDKAVSTEDPKRISSAIPYKKSLIESISEEEDSGKTQKITVGVQSGSEEEKVAKKSSKKRLAKKKEVVDKNDSEEEGEPKKKKELKCFKKKKGEERNAKGKQSSIAAILDKYSMSELEGMLKKLGDPNFKPCTCPKKSMEELLNAAKIVSEVLEKNTPEQSLSKSSAEERKVSWSEDEAPAEPNILYTEKPRQQDLFYKTDLRPLTTEAYTEEDVSSHSELYKLPEIPEEDSETEVDKPADEPEKPVVVCSCDSSRKDPELLQRPSTSNGRGKPLASNTILEKYMNVDLATEKSSSGAHKLYKRSLLQEEMNPMMYPMSLGEFSRKSDGSIEDTERFSQSMNKFKVAPLERGEGNERKSSIKNNDMKRSFVQKEDSFPLLPPDDYTINNSNTSDDSDLSFSEIPNKFQMVPLGRVEDAERKSLTKIPKRSLEKEESRTGIDAQKFQNEFAKKISSANEGSEYGQQFTKKISAANEGSEFGQQFTKKISAANEGSEFGQQEIINKFQMAPLATVEEESLETNSDIEEKSRGSKSKTSFLTKKGYVKLKQVFKYKGKEIVVDRQKCYDSGCCEKEEFETFMSLDVEKDGGRVKDGAKEETGKEEKENCGKCSGKRRNLDESDSVSSDL